MSDCDFCDNPDVRAREIVREAHAWAVPTYIPITPGHTLVLPVRHVATLEELTREEQEALFSLAERVKGALWKAFGAEGFNIAWNEGRTAGQSVPHFHVHIVPRTTGDAGVLGYEPREFLYRPGSRATTPEADLRDIAGIIRAAL